MWKLISKVDDQGERPHLPASVRVDDDAVPDVGKDVAQCMIKRFSSGALQDQIAECNVDTTRASLRGSLLGLVQGVQS